MEEFILRVGTYLIVVGVGIFILFIASEYAAQTNFDYLFWALILMMSGMLLRRRKPSPPPSERFSILRRLRSRNQEKK